MSPLAQVAVGVTAFAIVVTSAIGAFVGLLKLEDRQQRRNREATR